MRRNDLQRRLARTEPIIAAAIFAALTLWTAHHQTPELVGGDGTEYYRMMRQFAAGLPRVRAEGPFVFRIGMPWLASVAGPILSYVTPSGLDDVIAHRAGVHGLVPFYVINIASAFVAVTLLLLYLRRFVDSAGIRLLLVTMWMAAWCAPVRFVFFAPVNIEPMFLAFVTAGLLLIEGTPDRPVWLTACAVTLIVFFGTLVRESALLVAVVFVVRYYSVKDTGAPRWHDLAVVAPLVAWAVGITFTHAIGFASNAYMPWSEPINMLRRKPVFTWVLAWFFTFGPGSVALLAAAGHETLDFLRRRPHLGVHLTACGILAFFGGTDTERILVWAAPVFLVLVGRAIEQNRQLLSAAPLLVLALALTQIVSDRILWPIPVGMDNIQPFSTLGVSRASLYEVFNRLLVIDTHYINLWSFFGSRPLHAFILACDVSFVTAMAIVMRRRRHAMTGH